MGKRKEPMIPRENGIRMQLKIQEEALRELGMKKGVLKDSIMAVGGDIRMRFLLFK